MNQATPAPHGQGGLNLTPSDIFFILFRHKTKIVLFALLGITAGAFIYKTWPKEYQSNAQLLVRYVTEKRDVVDSSQDTRVTNAGGRGNEHILQTEIAIITSLDLAKKVAQRMGPEQIVPEYPEDSNAPIEVIATDVIASGLNAGASANVITVSFTNDNPELTQPILQSIIDAYIERHVEIHMGNDGTFDDYLTQQTDQLKSKLNQTENELLKVLNRAGITDLQNAKSTLSSEISRIEQAILQADVELAENLSAIESVASRTVKSEPEKGESNEPISIPTMDKDLADAVENYENTRTALEILKSRERELLMRYTGSNSLVQGVRNQITLSEQTLSKIESDFPEVNQSQALLKSSNEGSRVSEAGLVFAQHVRIRALRAKLDVLNKQLKELKVKIKDIEAIEVTVNELERRKKLEESNYQNFLTSLERTRLNEALSSGKINNISVIQSPSQVSLALTDKLKFSGMAIVGISAIGVVWAFLMELLIDRTIKRPIEIQRDVGLPLFMTIPDTKGKAFKKLTQNSSTSSKQIFGKRKAVEAKSKKTYIPKSSTLQAAAKSNPEYYGISGDSEDGNKEITPWDINHPLHNYFEALRDKVISYFESKNLQHKPKLIGLTGLGEDPGVSTVASGIASSLSQTEGGNVLLVDMTLGKESAHQFYKGKEVSNLEEALMEPHKARLQDNLYVVAEGSNGYKLPSLLPSRFNSIIPKLKASDFDYIVFDMPAVSPISSTPRLASFMDVMLLVIESENTNKEVVKQAAALLSESKAHLGAVLNKTKSYVPKQLEQDFIGLS